MSIKAKLYIKSKPCRTVNLAGSDSRQGTSYNSSTQQENTLIKESEDVK